MNHLENLVLNQGFTKLSQLGLEDKVRDLRWERIQKLRDSASMDPEAFRQQMLDDYSVLGTGAKGAVSGGKLLGLGGLIGGAVFSPSGGGWKNKLLHAGTSGLKWGLGGAGLGGVAGGYAGGKVRSKAESADLDDLKRWQKRRANKATRLAKRWDYEA